MNLNKRLLPITEILLKENKYVTTDYIANSLNVSNKTIRNDVLELEVLIKEHNLILDKKTGSGMAIIGDENLKLGLLSNLKLKCNSIIAYSPEDRKTYILKKLLSTDTTTSIRELISTLYVSRTTIKNDLILAEEWLNNYNISIIRNSTKGIEVTGKEKNIRKALGALICYDREYKDINELLNSNSHTMSTIPSIKSFDDILKIDFEDLRETLFSVKELHFDKYSDQSLLSLLVQIAITINRLDKNRFVGITEASQDSLILKTGYAYVKSLSEKLGSKYNISIPKSEIAYFSLLILGLNLSNKSNLDSHVSNNELCNSDHRIIAVDIINTWENILNIPLSKDERLLSSLVLHLSPVIHRLKYSLPISNPILWEIKSTYPHSYAVATSATNVIKAHTGFDTPEAEIGYLTAHLVSAVDRMEKPLNTLLICHSSIGVSELLYSKIKLECPKVSILSCISLNSIEEYDFTSIDLVITTVPLAYELDCQVILINTLLRKEDVSRLNSLVKKLYSQKNKLVTSIKP